MVRIEVTDTDRAKELIRVLITRIGAEPVSFDPETGEVCVDGEGDDGLVSTLGAVDAWLTDTDVAVIRVLEGPRSFTLRGAAL